MLNLENVVGNRIEVQLKPGKAKKVGTLFIVDRVGKYIILLIQDGRPHSKKRFTVIYFHAINNVSNLGTCHRHIRNTIKPSTKDTSFNQICLHKHISEETQRKQERLFSLLSEQLMDPVVDNADGKISILHGAAEIHPPYTSACCKAINPMVLRRLRSAVSRLDPHDKAEKRFIQNQTANLSTPMHRKDTDEIKIVDVEVDNAKLLLAFEEFLSNITVQKWKYNLGNIVESCLLNNQNLNEDIVTLHDDLRNIKYLIPIEGFIYGQIANRSHASIIKTHFEIESFSIINNEVVTIAGISSKLQDFFDERAKSRNVIGYFAASNGFGTSFPGLLDKSVIPSRNEGFFMVIDLIKSDAKQVCYATYAR